MASLPRKKFLTRGQQQAAQNTWKGRYLAAAKKNSILYVGLPFFAIMLAGTYMLSEFSSIRYEQHDRKHTDVSEREKLDISGRRRSVNIKDEFYRLQQLDVDNWEQKRVKRLPGESENKW